MARRLDLRRLMRSVRTSGIGLIMLALVAMWGIELIDTTVLDDRLQGGGIHPRQADGIDGILWAPFLHVDWGHLASNSIPLAVMGGLVATRGFYYWSRVTATVLLAGGVATWLLAGGGNHLGASGVVFGYFGVLLGAAWFERNTAALGAALLAIFLYSGLVAGLVPQPNLSWEGHLFGFLAGVVVAKILAPPRVYRDPDDPGDVQPWELDYPWIE